MDKKDVYIHTMEFCSAMKKNNRKLYVKQLKSDSNAACFLSYGDPRF